MCRNCSEIITNVGQNTIKHECNTINDLVIFIRKISQQTDSDVRGIIGTDNSSIELYKILDLVIQHDLILTDIHRCHAHKPAKLWLTLQRRPYEYVSTYELANQYGTFKVPADTPSCIITNDLKRNKLRTDYIGYELIPYLKPNSVFLDVGACFGLVSYQIAKHYEVLGGGTVIAFEANPQLLDIIRFNVTHNINTDIVKFYLVNAIIGDETIKVDGFPKPEPRKHGNSLVTYGSFGLTYKSDTVFKLPVLYIDDFLLTNVSAMKVDVEGADLAVLRGAKWTIINNRMPIIFEHGAVASSNDPSDPQYEMFTTDEYLRFIHEIDYQIHKRIRNDWLIVAK
jgi:FkbM family methyltransferase